MGRSFGGGEKLGGRLANARATDSRISWRVVSRLASRVAFATLGCLVSAGITGATGATGATRAAGAAELPSVGLSSVRAQRFGRADLPNANALGSDFFGFASVAGDFNGDGVDDLATGVPESRGPAPFVNGCGQVVVRYGVRGRGLDRVSPPTVLGQFISGGAEAEDRFGRALAACDFNGDGIADLAVGVPDEDRQLSTFNFPDAGVVSIYLGSTSGLAATPSITVGQSTATGLPESDMHFGEILACGHFDGDAFADLVVGVPDHAVGDLEQAGILRVFRGAGTALGLAPVPYRLDQDSAGIDDSANLQDRFGAALAVGDFDNDGLDDVATSVPGENFGSFAPAAVHILFGSAGGLGATGRNQLIAGPSEAQASSWGRRLASGDFNDDDFDDLVIGVPEDDTPLSNTGAVYVLQHTEGVFDLATAQRLTAEEIFGGSASLPGEYFGDALAVGDFNGDRLEDLAIGVPDESVEGIREGAVVVLLGEEGFGIYAGESPARQFEHGQEEIPRGDDIHAVRWGSALTTGDFDGDGLADLAVGALSEDDGTVPIVGSVTALYSALFADGFGNATLSPSYWSATAAAP